MNRAFSTICLALLMIGFVGTPAAAKPMIAVLGLEVVDPSGTPSAQDTQVAKELSDGLRARAKAGTGQYQLAPGSDKELIDQKLLNNCDTEAPACMGAIGNQLGAEILMYGKIQKEGKTSFQVTLRVLDVPNKKVLKSSTDLIPISEASGAALQGWAKKIYAKLTGEQSTGAVIVRVSNADRGTILIDGEEKGNITNGQGQVSGLAEGKYKVAVESDGFRRWEGSVSIGAGQTATLSAVLEKGGIGPGIGPGPGPGPSPGRGPEGTSGTGLWKGVFVGAAVVAVAGAGWWYLNFGKLADEHEFQCTRGAIHDGCTPNTSNGSLTQTQLDASNKKGDDAANMTKVGVAVMGVGVAVAAFAFYKGFIAGGSKESSTSASNKRGKRVRRDRFVITPVVSPDGGGATLRLDW